MGASSFVCGTAVLLMVAVCCSRLLYRQYFGQQDCEMTYMYQYPQYQEIGLPAEVEAQYPQYGLFYYYEGQQRKSVQQFRGVPVLFLPGNAGSHKQTRSSASIALRMHSSDFASLRHFDFFTISFNEEFSGMFGGVLQAQTSYVAACIQHILSLYKGVKPRPHSVVIIAHSMGGVIARGLFALPDFNHSTITTIVALSSPLLRPVLSFDPLIQQYYEDVEEAWSRLSEAMSAVTLVSIAGGERDVMVPAHLSIMPTAINLATPAVPRNWASADHLAVVWCRRVQLAITRALFVLQDRSGRGLTANHTHQQNTFRHLLLEGKEVPQVDPTLKPVKAGGVVFANETQLQQTAGKKTSKSVALPLPENDVRIVAASDTHQRSWLHVCSVLAKNITCRDISSECSLLPPKSNTLKIAAFNRKHLQSLLPQATHLLVPTPSPYTSVQTCESSPHSLTLPWLKEIVMLPAGHCPFLNLSLPLLTQVWQAYSVRVESSCGGRVSGGLVIPWYPHSSLSNSTSPLTLSLTLLAPPPSRSATPPHLLLWTPTECDLSIEVTPDPWRLLDKLAVLHLPLLLPWVTALSIVASVPSWNLNFDLLLAVLFLRTVTK